MGDASGSVEIFHYTAIGYIDSCYRDKFAVPRQPGLAPSSWAKLTLERKWQPEISLDGLSQFSHLWVMFAFHLNQNKKFHAKVHPPRLGGGTMGVFSTRSPHRPNPIGLSLVKLESIENEALILSGCDLAHKTPVLDIKPYIPQYESVPEAKAGWIDALCDTPIEVTFAAGLVDFLNRCATPVPPSRLEQIIRETLAYDPRPRAYRTAAFADKEHVFQIFDFDVYFRFINELQILVTDLKQRRENESQKSS